MNPSPRQSAKAGLVWRLISPAGFLLALVVFPLPWLEVRCNAPGELVNLLNPGGPPIRSVVMVTQSGLESAYGGYRRGPHVSYYLEDLKDLKYLPRLLERTTVEPAWLMSAYGVVLGLGLLLGMVLPANRWRSAAVAGCAAAAVSLLAAQTALEFPMVHHLKEIHADPTWGVQEAAALRHVGQVQYTPFFYLAWGLTIATIVVVGVEWLVLRSLTLMRPVMPPRTPYVYDDD